MSPTCVLVFVFLIGVIAGLRSFTAPATVAWGLRLGWFTVGSSRLAFMGSIAGVVIISLLAFGELVADKLPSTPNRTSPVGLIGRFILGGFAGVILACAGGQRPILGAVLGGVGGIAGAFAGYQVRTRLVKVLKCPDFVIAILEDAVAIGGGPVHRVTFSVVSGSVQLRVYTRHHWLKPVPQKQFPNRFRKSIYLSRASHKHAVT